MTRPDKKPDVTPTGPADESAAEAPKQRRDEKRNEIGGRKGLDPTRYGDWEKDGRAIDFYAAVRRLLRHMEYLLQP